MVKGAAQCSSGATPPTGPPTPAPPPPSLPLPCRVSHQIWHFFVWLAGAAWLHGLLHYHDWRTAHVTCDAPAA